MIRVYPVTGTRSSFLYTLTYGGSERHRKSGERSLSLCKQSFETQHGRISIDPVILTAIKNAEAALAETRNQRLLGLRFEIIPVIC